MIHRKTLGDPESRCAKELRRLIEETDKEIVCLWCIDIARQRMLPVFQRQAPGDERPQRTLEAALAYLSGAVSFREVKRIILGECHAAAREAQAFPAARAAARACAHAASSVHSKRHALGIFFYGAAAIAYEKLGAQAGKEDYEQVAEALCRELLGSLREMLAERTEEGTNERISLAAGNERKDA